MAEETVPWNQCLPCILRLRRPPTSSSRANRLGRAPLPFPLPSILGSRSSPKRRSFLDSGARELGCPSLVARSPRAVPPGFLPTSRWSLFPAFRLNVFPRVDSRCAIARVSPPRSPRRPRSSACVRGAVAPIHRCRGACAPSANLVRCLALHGTEVPGLTVLRGPCRARPPRSSRALGHDELGHPGLTAAPGGELRFRVGAVPAVTPVPFRPTSTTHDSFDKERALALVLVHSARFPRDREPSVHAEQLTEASSFRPREALSSSRGAPSVPRTLRHRSLARAAHCAVLPRPRAPGRTASAGVGPGRSM